MDRSEYSYEGDSSRRNLNLTEMLEEESQLLDKESMTVLSELDEMYEEDIETTSAGEGKIIKTTLYRWPVLLALGSNICLNSMIYMGIAPVAPVVRDAYNLPSDFWPNFC